MKIKDMTQEDKELLLKDLYARLPYYPKCEMIDELRVVNNEKDSSYISTLFLKHIELFSYHNNFIIKPYLHSLSSITKEEKEELIKNFWGSHTAKDTFEELSWYLSKHFDINELIPKGLAIEVTEENNPYKE